MVKSYEVSVVISGKDKLSQTLDGITKGAMERVGHKVTELISQLPQMAVEMVQLGAAVNRQANALDNMAQSFGTSGDAIISAIQEASGYTIDSMTAMQAANRAMMLDVADSPKEFERLTEVATRLGRVMGLDATQSINDFVTAAGRQSIMIADNLGLTIKVGDANEAYAAQLGKTADELTKAEQKQAFLNAMLDAGEEKLSTLGPEVADAATNIEMMQAAVEDAKIGLASWAAEMVNSAINLGELATKVREFPGWLESHTAAFGAAQDAWILGTDAIQTFDDVLAQAITSEADMATEAERWAIAGRDVTASTVEATAAVQTWNAALIPTIMSTEQAAANWERMNLAVYEYGERGPEIQEYVTAVNMKMHEQAAAAEAASIGIDGLLPPSIAFTEQLEEMAVKEEEAALEAQKLTEEADILAAMAGDTFVAAAGDAIDETDTWSIALFEAADAAGADAQELALLAGGLGIYTDEQIQAALATVALTTTIDQLGTAIANGTMTTAEAIFELRKQIDLMQFSIGITDRNTSTTRRSSGATRENTEARRKNAEKAREQARAERELERALARTGDHFVEFVEQAEIGTDVTNAWGRALFNAADAAGADAEELALLAGALGLYTEEQVEAALTAAAMQEKIEQLAAEIAGGMGIDEAMKKFNEFSEGLELPEWIQPGSPTPLEMGIRGISNAMTELAGIQLPRFQMMMGGTDARGGQQVTNNFNMTVSTQAPISTVQQDFATMAALAQ
ncbi:MAG: hypothetical protein GWN93_06645 [Deltaproteobacteria bacterium]|nr:hypothetical protein [Deltaproteobacteria bacterium]